jgi:6-phosphogluconolactonase
MNRVEQLRFDTDDALAAHAAQRWIGRVAKDSCQGSLHTCALSGGRIARRLLEAIEHTHTGLDRVHFFWADERCVPPDHPDSNYRVAAEALLQPARVPADRIHRIEGERPPGEACALAERDLRIHLNAAAEDVPILDWVFLGMGEDGHVASLFPGAPADATPACRAYVAVRGPKPPPHRISLTYAVLAAAREVCVLVSGPGKHEALARSLATPENTPLAKVIRSRTTTTVLVSG